MGKKRERKLTITQQIMQQVYDRLKIHEHDLTRKQYARQTKQYIKFCREQFNCRTFGECAMHIQNYSNHLQREGYSASTIHTYLAAVCNVFETKLENISKPKRHTAEYSKGRKNTLQEAENDLNNPKHAYLIEFQRRVGLRRDELMHLRGNDLIKDESNHLCIRVIRGKGGKMQLQRVLPEDEAFIKLYFENVSSSEYVFGRKYFKNDLNLHALRAESARQYYNSQLQKIKENPSYRAQLEKEILARWNVMNRNKAGKIKPFLSTEMHGIYTLRGKNRVLAKEKNLPLHYDKTALLATSIFKLSHWRNDVTIASYMLA